MKKYRICKTCGKVLYAEEDFAEGESGNDYCRDCADEFGNRKRYSQIVKDTKELLTSQMGISEREAEETAKENVSRIPFWIQQEQIFSAKKNIIIIDTGSTTTKALLLHRENEEYSIRSLQFSATTVEKPTEDVNFGVLASIKKIETDTGLKLLEPDSNETNLNFVPDTICLATSSAGGGLQILVIGLTLFDSASSGKRTAFGAGGVILDTFAIDDKRSSLEQMTAMGILHPDIILMAGGVNGGAVSPILRLGEILLLSNPKPKFGEKNKIPLIFAGNEAAQYYIAGLFQQKFELFMVPNIRPTLSQENLAPAREKIHKLFMDNVMEQAPGYAKLKSTVADEIIPTPTGVIQALQLVSESMEKNVMSVDIGGATTDIFSNIMGYYFRTVSANYGMSYSISNVLKDADISQIKKWLPEDMEEDYIRNYIGNKMLYPTFNPDNAYQIAIEQAIAREAIALSKIQHMKMNFNTDNIGFLDKIVNIHRDLSKISETFFFEKALDKKQFRMYDIDLLIGAGGILAHTENEMQALSIIDAGFKPEGITEIWKDRNFITPHLGKLSSINEKLALRLLQEDCFLKLGIIIRPLAKKWKSKAPVMTIKIDDETRQIKVGDLEFIPNKKRKNLNLKIELEKGFYLNEEGRNLEFQTALPMIIDAAPSHDFTKLNSLLQMYKFKNKSSLEQDFAEYLQFNRFRNEQNSIKIELPYEGKIIVKPEDKVTPDTIIGENLYDPPKVYAITLFDKTYLHLNQENLKQSLLIKENEEVKYGQRIVEVGRGSFLEELQFQHYYFESPVRGKVEKINYDSGTIIMREIQDYSSKPSKINIAKKLNIQPKLVPRYLKKQLNDFVYAGEMLASRIIDVQGTGHPMLITAPKTGRICELDTEKGTIVIMYDKKPYRKLAGVFGTVTKIEPGRSATVSYTGKTLKGIIGFGAESWGKINYLEDISSYDNCRDTDVAVFPGKINIELLKNLKELKVKGVIAASINNLDLVEFIGTEIGVALTGNEHIPFPLILTEGFGDFSMSQAYCEIFKENQANAIYINGHTQIRAGVIRPTMIISNN
jgi:uncharacterized protein (TIGR01319 family)